MARTSCGDGGHLGLVASGEHRSGDELAHATEIGSVKAARGRGGRSDADSAA